MAEVGLRTLLAFLLLWTGPVGRVWAMGVCAPDCEPPAALACETTCPDDHGDAVAGDDEPREPALLCCFCCEIGLPCAECVCCVARELTPRSAAEVRGALPVAFASHAHAATASDDCAADARGCNSTFALPLGRASAPTFPLRI